MPTQDNLYRFLEIARQNNPDKIATDDNGKTMTYQQLQQRVHELLWIFQNKGIRRGQFVGVHLKPSGELVAILLAITKLGAIFVPLESSYPNKRLLFMINDAELSCVITEKPMADFTDQISCPILFLSDLVVNSSFELELEAREPEPQDVCYVIYTSGTTGDPKGVLVTYAGGMNTVVQSALTMDVQPSHRLLQLSPISFDIFVLEVGMVLFAGATEVFTDDVGKIPLDEILITHDIQHILCTPNFVADVELDKTPLHTIMFGGEPMPQSLAGKYIERFRIVHAYGVTEAAMCSTLGLCDGSYPVSIGTPIANTTLELVDENLNPVAVGEVGEIVVGGKGIANGYINRPEVEAYRFIPDPQQPGKKRFRTGDMAKFDAQGNLYFLGRNDRQVKYREHRLELFEVEALLLRHPQVNQAAVLLHEDQLYGFVCLKEEGGDLPAITQHLKQYLLESLVPEVRQLSAMPLTSHNKIDYAKIREGI